MKLKTLKDFEGLCNSKGEKFILFCLKHEAIKWVRFYEKLNDLAAAGAIGHFCNITKKDLK